MCTKTVCECEWKGSAGENAAHCLRLPLFLRNWMQCLLSGSMVLNIERDLRLIGFEALFVLQKTNRAQIPFKARLLVSYAKSINSHYKSTKIASILNSIISFVSNFRSIVNSVQEKPSQHEWKKHNCQHLSSQPVLLNAHVHTQTHNTYNLQLWRNRYLGDGKLK